MSTQREQAGAALKLVTKLGETLMNTSAVKGHGIEDLPPMLGTVTLSLLQTALSHPEWAVALLDQAQLYGEDSLVDESWLQLFPMSATYDLKELEDLDNQDK